MRVRREYRSSFQRANETSISGTFQILGPERPNPARSVRSDVVFQRPPKNHVFIEVSRKPVKGRRRIDEWPQARSENNEHERRLNSLFSYTEPD